MRKNKFAILALAMSAFAIGMTEFISVGLLPLIKDSFNMTTSLAGLTVSLYAVGVTIGAPLLTPLTNKIKRKHLLIGIMLIFIIANTLAAFSTTFSMLLAMRVLSALMHGVFMSIATAIASDLYRFNGCDNHRCATWNLDRSTIGLGSFIYNNCDYWLFKFSN